MLSFSHLQHKLGFELQHGYTKKVFECTSAADLVTPTKDFIEELVDR